MSGVSPATDRPPTKSTGKESFMPAAKLSTRVERSGESGWLLQKGPRELECLFRAIICHPAASILVADDDRNNRDASVGAGRLLGLPREKLIGRRLDDFAAPGFQSEIDDLW